MLDIEIPLPSPPPPAGPPVPGYNRASGLFLPADLPDAWRLSGFFL